MRCFDRGPGMNRSRTRSPWAAGLALAGLTVFLLWSCTATKQSAIRVPEEPPLPQFETAPVKPADSSVWVPGFWDWSERDASWQWVAGRWEVPPRPGAVWVPPSHARSGNGWVLTRGGWQ